MGTLDSLFPSTRKALLAALLQQPEKRFYLRELIRLVHKGQGSVQRELGNLVQAGILLREKGAGRTFFRANVSCPIFPELSLIVTKTVGIVAQLEKTLKPLRGKIRTAFVFGSLASGHARPDSDVDLAVVGNLSFRSVVRALGKVQMKLGREVNPVVFTEGEFKKRVAEGEHFVAELLRTEKLFILGTPDDLAAVAGKQVGG